MQFYPERLKKVRESLGINKAQAARLLNMSAMGYGRYEKGEREPSFQVVSFVAEIFGTSSDYLYGLSDIQTKKTIIVSYDDSPELFEIVNLLKHNEELTTRMLSYLRKTHSEE
jgi:transcriptional regulator with XRE-family HTH domain